MIFNVEDSIYREANSTPLTPEDVACDMIQLVRDTGFFDEVPEGTDLVKWAECHKVCDIYCKSGVFLMICYWLFMRSLIVVIDDFEARKKFVIDNLLYAFNPNSAVCRLLRLDLYGDASRLGHIYELSVRDETKVKEIFGDMKFDVVVGNPPYNDDMYLDFVMLGHRLSKQYSLWITPAKWQAKAGSDNESVRNTISNYASSINYYPDVKDVFNITLGGGVCYYLLTKLTQDFTTVVNKSEAVNSFNNVVNRRLGSFPVLNNILNSIISKFDEYERFRPYSITAEYFGFKSGYHGSGSGDFKLMQGSNIVGYVDESDILKNKQSVEYYKVVMHLMNSGMTLDKNGSTLGIKPTIVLSKDELPIYNYMYIFKSTDRLSCESLSSYISSKLIKFVMWSSLIGEGLNNNESWRFVPDPGSFDKIYEDKPLDGYTPDENGEYIDSDGNKHCSLYVKYKLTDEEINVIESVIRERK